MCVEGDAVSHQVRDVSMTQLMRRHIKIQTVNNVPVVASFFTQDRIECVFHIFPSDVFFRRARLRCPCCNVGPKSFELSVRKWLTVFVGNHIF